MDEVTVIPPPKRVQESKVIISLFFNKIQNTKYKIQNTKYKIQNTKYKKKKVKPKDIIKLFV